MKFEIAWRIFSLASCNLFAERVVSPSKLVTPALVGARRQDAPVHLLGGRQIAFLMYGECGLYRSKNIISMMRAMAEKPARYVAEYVWAFGNYIVHGGALTGFRAMYFRETAWHGRTVRMRLRLSCQIFRASSLLPVTHSTRPDARHSGSGLGVIGATQNSSSSQIFQAVFLQPC